ncbi:hypothetical protein [Nonomuraea sp. NPDC049709]|uniref:hypothetical protein n=1 Tax=Nonomuraea sp. NPDC049709 TaxID=3154736 RepID=UPI00342AD801
MVNAPEAAARRRAGAQVWRIAAAAVPVLLPAPGVRPRNGLAGPSRRPRRRPGATLRLELTPEAADALETETTFEVRLQLPPGTPARLCATLPGMLRPFEQVPELIGF